MDDSNTRLCDLCDISPVKYTCSGCKKVQYCSQHCQKEAWVTHIFDCSPGLKPIASYHYLFRAVARDLIPTHAQTLEDWGFNRANASADDHGQSNLLGVYQLVIKHYQIVLAPKTLEKWRKRGVLLQEIKKAIERLPEGGRGEYYAWLVQNPYVLDRSLPVPACESAEDMAMRYLRDGWLFATKDQSKSVAEIKSRVDSWPLQKRYCLLLCGMIFNNASPHPTEEFWVRFGFCAGDQGDELYLGSCYRQLLETTSFEELYTAYQNSDVFSLFRRKGITMLVELLYTVPRRVRELEDVLRGTGRGIFKSCWFLKQWVGVQSDAPSPDFGMDLSVRVDYGFANCRGLEDFGTLLQIYKDYFDSHKADCLALHEACIKGELFKYLRRFARFKLEKKHRALLKNPYPLHHSGPQEQAYEGPPPSFHIPSHSLPVNCNCSGPPQEEDTPEYGLAANPAPFPETEAAHEVQTPHRSNLNNSGLGEDDPGLPPSPTCAFAHPIEPAENTPFFEEVGGKNSDIGMTGTASDSNPSRSPFEGGHASEMKEGDWTNGRVFPANGPVLLGAAPLGHIPTAERDNAAKPGQPAGSIVGPVTSRPNDSSSSGSSSVLALFAAAAIFAITHW
jgi:hypothetical protein